MSGTVRDDELRWGLFDAADYFGYSDLVVGSDLTYNSGSWRVLDETLGGVLKTDIVVLYLALGHYGFNVSGGMAGFLSVIESQVLELVNEGSKRWTFGDKIKSLSRVLEHCTRTEERSLVDATGGDRAIVLKKKQIKILQCRRS